MDKNPNNDIIENEVDTKIKCPECGSEDIMVAGHCLTCLECGWSLCSL